MLAYFLQEHWVVNKNTINPTFIAVKEANNFNAVSNFDLQINIVEYILLYV